MTSCSKPTRAAASPHIPQSSRAAAAAPARCNTEKSVSVWETAAAGSDGLTGRSQPGEPDGEHHHTLVDQRREQGDAGGGTGRCQSLFRSRDDGRNGQRHLGGFRRRPRSHPPPRISATSLRGGAPAALPAGLRGGKPPWSPKPFCSLTPAANTISHPHDPLPPDSHSFSTVGSSSFTHSISSTVCSIFILSSLSTQ